MIVFEYAVFFTRCTYIFRRNNREESIKYICNEHIRSEELFFENDAFEKIEDQNERFVFLDIFTEESAIKHSSRVREKTTFLVSCASARYMMRGHRQGQIVYSLHHDGTDMKQ